jgi:serine/threonine protein kinase
MFKTINKGKNRNFTEKEIKSFMFDLCSALLYLHSNQYIHGDIKPENILRFPEKRMKLCDFGSTLISDRTIEKETSCVCTRWYRAPELILGSKFYDQAIDVFSLG